jgi:hypothetical protein
LVTQSKTKAMPGAWFSVISAIVVGAGRSFCLRRRVLCDAGARPKKILALHVFFIDSAAPLFG